MRLGLAPSGLGALAFLAACSGSAEAAFECASAADAVAKLATAVAEPDAARIALEARFANRPPEDLVRGRFELGERLRAGVADADRPAIELELGVLEAGLHAREGIELEGRPAAPIPRGGEPEWRTRYAGATRADLDVAAWRLGLWLADDLRRAFDARFTSGPVTRVLSDTFLEA